MSTSGDPRLDHFDEEFYLDKYPDVADAVRKWIFSSGRQHFAAFGIKEGRTGFERRIGAAAAIMQLLGGALWFALVFAFWLSGVFLRRLGGGAARLLTFISRGLDIEQACN